MERGWLRINLLIFAGRSGAGCISTAGSAQGGDFSVVRCDQYDIGNSQKESGAHHARHRQQITFEASGTLNCRYPAIEDQIAVVGDELAAGGIKPHSWFKSELTDLTHSQRCREGHHFDREIAAFAQPVDYFFIA